MSLLKQVVDFPEDGLQSEYTVLVYLNGGDADYLLEGGETVFYDGPNESTVACSFSPRCGWGLFHGHGGQCLLHEGAVVRNGVKYVLRTDVLFEARV